MVHPQDPLDPAPHARAYRLLARAGLSGYDLGSRTFRPWHRLSRYRVRFRAGKSGAHLLGGSIVLSDPARQCPHVLLHDFVHEVGHAQLLFLDIAVFSVLLSLLTGAPWYGYLVALLAWHFVWRELAADLYAVAVLGLRNTWRGYSHIDRRGRRRQRPAAGSPGGVQVTAASASPVDRIKEDAALVVTMARDLGVDVDFDEAAVRWLDGFIQRQHERGKPEIHEGLVNTLGSFLGECVIRVYGGTWADLDGSWGVRFDDKNAVFPFAKVSKHLKHGAGDSVLSFFSMIPRVFKGKFPPR